MMKFQILAPAWRADSAGVRYLWALGHQLEQLGHTVTMLNIAQSHAAAAPDTVVIYPEIVTGNPLMAQRVVRYYLNKEGMAMGNPVLPEAQDFVLTFFPHYHPKPHYNLKVFFDLEDFWHNDHVPSLLRTQDCCLIGKGRFYTHCTVPQGAREISPNRPVPRSELPQLLAQTRLLYTWDSNSGMCIEAVLSGCLVVILQYYPLTTDQIFYPTVTVQDGQIIVPHDYDQQRLLWRQQLMQTNENYAQNVQTLVQKLEAHWG